MNGKVISVFPDFIYYSLRCTSIIKYIHRRVRLVVSPSINLFVHPLIGPFFFIQTRMRTDVFYTIMILS